MPRGTLLTDSEKAKITAYHDASYSNRKIAEKLGRSPTVIRNFLRLGENYGRNVRYDRNKKLTSRDKQLIFREARKNKMFASQIKTEMSLPVTTRRVQQILKSDNNMIFKKPCKKPCLTGAHKLKRLDFAIQHMSWTNEWRRVLFSDKKKFNLDGPDGFSYYEYWHDKRLQEDVRMSRNFGGGSVMVWAGFGANGKTNTAWVPPKMNAEKYTEMLEEMMVDQAEDICGVDFLFQQDNASVHSARRTAEWFREKNITVMDWPAGSTDLNPIENLWGILARKIYEHGKQYNDVRRL